MPARFSVVADQVKPAGSMILTEGTNADSFYIVTKGTVEVILPRVNQSDVVALQLGPGKFFGEMAFFHGRRRHASVRASESGPVEACQMLLLDPTLVGPALSPGWCLSCFRSRWIGDDSRTCR
jgi:CRP-like cAMP-binding protein